jgi:hypothetical protein
VAPYLMLMTEEAPQRMYALREVFNALRQILRVAEGHWAQPSAATPDSHTLQSGKRSQSWLRWGQAQAREEGPPGGGYVGAPVGPVRHRCQRVRPRPGRGDLARQVQEVTG